MTDTTERPLKVFLCHSSGDKPAIRVLCKELINRGVDVWLDEEKILPGQDWQREIPAAVRSSDAIIVCLSKNSITKEGYVQKEINFALNVAEEKPEGTIFIIPSRLEECDVPSRLSKWQYVDLFFKNGMFSSKGYEMLIKALRTRSIQIGASTPNDLYYSRLPQPLLVVVSGPSGVGKNALVNMMKDRGFPFRFVTPVTTRQPQQDESNGKDYIFTSKDEFIRMIENDQFLEYRNVYGDYEGTPKQQISDGLQIGQDVILCTDVKGAETIRRFLPGAVFIFITTEDEKELRSFLMQKKAYSEEEIQLHLAAARQELTQMYNFDYIVVNHVRHLDSTSEAVAEIISAEHHRANSRKLPSF
jgi:guanylate kinase